MPCIITKKSSLFDTNSSRGSAVVNSKSFDIFEKILLKHQNKNKNGYYEQISRTQHRILDDKASHDTPKSD